LVIGDLIGERGLPGVAQVAIQGGRYAADVIRRRVEGRPAPGPFHYHDKGSMATISRFSAVAAIGRLRLSGFVAWVAWLGVHLVYLIGFKNRVTTLLHWAVSFLGRGRAERTVTHQQVVARNVLRHHDVHHADQHGPAVVEGAVHDTRDTRANHHEPAAQQSRLESTGA
jgi:NADH dehydrogenase